MLHYTVFRTRWGWFGLASREDAVCRTFLPGADRAATEAGLLAPAAGRGQEARLERGLLRPLQDRIVGYFEGGNVDFSTDPAVFLAWITPFARKVLGACRKVPQGRTTTYRALAKQIGRPRAARAVGRVMAANPIPLIVPCHRVLRSDGGLGGFSGPGGTAAKLRLLEHEKGAVCAGAS